MNGLLLQRKAKWFFFPIDYFINLLLEFKKGCMLNGESLDNQYNFQVLMLHEALNVDTMHAIMPISVLSNGPIFSLKCEWLKKEIGFTSN